MSTTGCGGCNDGCLDESVQLQQGAQGETGATGAKGATGATGPQGPSGASVIDYQISDQTSSSSSWTQVYSKVIPGDTLESVDDFLRIELVLMCDQNSSSTGGQFGVRCLLGTPNMLPAIMFDTISVGYIAEQLGHPNAIKLVFDVIVSAADTVITRMSEFSSGSGFYTGDDYLIMKDSSMDFGVVTTTQTVDISANNTLSLRLKSTDNSTLFALNSVKITSHKV